MCHNLDHLFLIIMSDLPNLASEQHHFIHFSIKISKKFIELYIEQWHKFTYKDYLIKLFVIHWFLFMIA